MSKLAIIVAATVAILFCGASCLECRRDDQRRGCHWRQELLADHHGSRLPPKRPFGCRRGTHQVCKKKDWMLVRSLLV